MDSTPPIDPGGQSSSLSLSTYTFPSTTRPPNATSHSSPATFTLRSVEASLPSDIHKSAILPIDVHKAAYIPSTSPARPRLRSTRSSGTPRDRQLDPAISLVELHIRCGRRPPMTDKGKTTWYPSFPLLSHGDDGDDESEGLEAQAEAMTALGTSYLKMRQRAMQQHAAEKLFQASMNEDAAEASGRARFRPPRNPSRARRTSPSPSPLISRWSSSTESGPESVSSSPAYTPVRPYFRPDDIPHFGTFPGGKSSALQSGQSTLLAPFAVTPAKGADEYTSETDGVATPMPPPRSQPKRARFAKDDGLTQVRVFGPESEDDEPLEEYFMQWSPEDKLAILSQVAIAAAIDAAVESSISAKGTPAASPTLVRTASDPILSAQLMPTPRTTFISEDLEEAGVAISEDQEEISEASQRSELATSSTSDETPRQSPSPLPISSIDDGTATQPLSEFEGEPLLPSAEAPAHTVDESFPSADSAPSPPPHFFDVEPKETPAKVTDFVVA